MSWWAKYVGLEFENRARGPHTFDCWGLVCEVEHREFGKDLPSYSVYDDAFDKDETAPLFQDGIDTVPNDLVDRTDARDGDIVFLRYRGRVTHVGVFVSPNRILHIDRGCNSVCEALDNVSMRSRVEEIRRVR